MIETLTAPRLTEDDLADLRREVRADRARRRRLSRMAGKPASYFESCRKGYPGRPAPEPPPRAARPPQPHKSRLPRDRHPSSGYFGVERSGKGWRGIIHHDGKAIRTAIFPTDADAARARDHLALELRGTTAALNFPEMRGSLAS